MDNLLISRKFLFITVALSLIISLVIFLSFSFDKKSKVVFCDVGQGDGAYVRVKNKVDVLIDAGPSRDILTCLGKYMPFYDHTIEFVIISHPEKDHFGGLLYLINRYKIGQIFISPTRRENQTFQLLIEKIKEKQIPLFSVKANDKLTIFNDRFVFYWPSNDFLMNELGNGRSSNLNDFSLVLMLEEGDFRALFTGDASPFVLDNLLKSKVFKNIHTIDVLKVPHHGSTNGLIESFLLKVNPKIAIISVGNNNSYGHPSKKIINMLQTHKVKIKRTDEEGNIFFKIKN